MDQLLELDKVNRIIKRFERIVELEKKFPLSDAEFAEYQRLVAQHYTPVQSKEICPMCGKVL